MFVTQCVFVFLLPLSISFISIAIGTHFSHKSFTWSVCNQLYFFLSLMALDPTFINLPMQATKVCLAGIKPKPFEKSDEACKSMVKDTNWSIESLKQFYSIVANKRLIAEIVVGHLFIYFYIIVGMLVIPRNISYCRISYPIFVVSVVMSKKQIVYIFF